MAMPMAFDWSGMEEMLREKYGFVLESNAKASSNIAWFKLGSLRGIDVCLSCIGGIGICSMGEKAELTEELLRLLDDIGQTFGKSERQTEFGDSDLTIVFFNIGEENRAQEILEDLC